jgi:hypothetical protein
LLPSSGINGFDLLPSSGINGFDLLPSSGINGFDLLQKLDGLTHIKLKENITKVISEIPKEKYKNIFKGAYVMKDQKNM